MVGCPSLEAHRDAQLDVGRRSAARQMEVMAASTWIYEGSGTQVRAMGFFHVGLTSTTVAHAVYVMRAGADGLRHYRVIRPAGGYNEKYDGRL
ncbi:MAG: hypothetical protein AAFZ01_02545 [Pseudomonadota bacterium]